MRRSRLLLAAVLVLAARPALADVVHLSDGRELEGTVVEQNDKTIKLRVVRGTTTVVLELAKDDVRTIEKRSVDVSKLARDAEDALGQGQRDDAIRILRTIVLARPGEARWLRELAFAELLAEDLEHARDDYGRATALDPIDVEALTGVGYCAARLGDRELAIDAYRRATRAGPQHAKAWKALAQLLLERHAATGDRPGNGDREEAIASARRALEAEPQDAEAVVLAGEAYGRAQGIGSREDHAQGLALLEGWLAKNAAIPGSVEVARKTAELALRRGEPDRARAAFARVVQARPPLDEAGRERLLALEALHAWIAAGRPEPALGLDVTTADSGGASRRLDLALASAPREGALLLTRARLRVRVGLTSAARDDAIRARVLLEGPAREDAAAIDELLARQRGAAPLPLARAKRAAELLPFSRVAQEELALSLEAAGELAAARDAYRAAAGMGLSVPERLRLELEAWRLEAEVQRRNRNKDL